MSDIIETLLNPWVFAYLAVVIVAQVFLARHRQASTRALQTKREAAGLPGDHVFLDHKQRLGTLRSEALLDAAVLVGTVIITPFVFMFIAYHKQGMQSLAGLATAFLILLLWILFSNAELGKAWLGGTLFKLLLSFKKPFQVGDRVTLLGYSGKVLEVNSFMIQLQTADDDLVSLPTYRLWSEPLVSANAGHRSSLCVIPFYLSPTISTEQLNKAEDAIWNAAQSSVYFDYAKPLQIYVSQQDNAIIMTVKAFVASTYNESLFKSDITRSFLESVDEHQLPLAINN